MYVCVFMWTSLCEWSKQVGRKFTQLMKMMMGDRNQPDPKRVKTSHKVSSVHFTDFDIYNIKNLPAISPTCAFVPMKLSNVFIYG